MKVPGTLVVANNKKKVLSSSRYRVALLCSTIATGEFTLIFRRKNLQKLGPFSKVVSHYLKDLNRENDGSELVLTMQEGQW